MFDARGGVLNDFVDLIGELAKQFEVNQRMTVHLHYRIGFDEGRVEQAQMWVYRMSIEVR